MRTRTRFYSLKEARKYLKEYQREFPFQNNLNIFHRKGAKTWWVCTAMEWLHFH
jgi:hypothetical protein